MIEKAKLVLQELPDTDRVALMVMYNQEPELSNEAKRLKSILDQLEEDELALVFNKSTNDASGTEDKGIAEETLGSS